MHEMRYRKSTQTSSMYSALIARKSRIRMLLHNHWLLSENIKVSQGDGLVFINIVISKPGHLAQSLHGAPGSER